MRQDEYFPMFSATETILFPFSFFLCKSLLFHFYTGGGAFYLNHQHFNSSLVFLEYKVSIQFKFS